MGVFAGVSISIVPEQKFDFMGLDPGGLPQGCDIALEKLDLFASLRNMLQAPLLQHENIYAIYHAGSYVEAISGIFLTRGNANCLEVSRLQHWVLRIRYESPTCCEVWRARTVFYYGRAEGAPHQSKFEFGFVEKPFSLWKDFLPRYRAHVQELQAEQSRRAKEAQDKETCTIMIDGCGAHKVFWLIPVYKMQGLHLLSSRLQIKRRLQWCRLISPTVTQRRQGFQSNLL